MNSTTLVGVFDSRSEAEQARERLMQAGLSAQNVSVSAGAADTLEAGSSRSAATANRPREDEGSISRFFSDLFGVDDEPDVRHYDEAVRRGHAVVTVQLDDDGRVDEVSELLENCGAVDVDERVASWKSSGYLASDDSDEIADSSAMSGRSALAGGAPGATRAGTDDESLDVVEEQLKVGKRTVERGGVRVRRYVTERPVEEQVSLHSEEARIDRQKVDRPATEADLQSAFQEKSIEVRETAEEAVVSKSARVVEEVHVGKVASDRTETVRDTLRSTQVEVEPLGEGRSSASAATSGARGAMAGAGASAANMAQRYAGPERRTNSGRPYAGVDRRMAA